MKRLSISVVIGAAVACAGASGLGASVTSVGTPGAVPTPRAHSAPSASSTNGFAAPRLASHMIPAVRRHPQHPQLASLSNTGGFSCQKPKGSSGGYNCYGPTQIRNAYSIQPLLDSGQDGSGRTITIIDAFQNPTMTSDLASFDSVFGLPAPPSFRIIAPFGITPFDSTNPNQVGWAGEIALDVEWAHAVAPGANIVLALSPSDADPDIFATESYVINNGIGDVISMSFGEAEQCMPPDVRQREHALFGTANTKGVTLFAGSGDEGAAQLTCDGSSYIKAVSIPASDPDVTGVGGTKLIANLNTGAYGSESVWNEPTQSGGGGGGFSSFYARPSFQNSVAGIPSMRGVPDVSYSASAAYGVVVGFGSSGSPGEFWIFDGTSCGTPQWAGIGAIADQSAQQSLGNINPALYRLAQASNKQSPFHDITTGNNDFLSIAGYSATVGWDAASGLGSPVSMNLVAGLSKK